MYKYLKYIIKSRNRLFQYIVCFIVIWKWIVDPQFVRAEKLLYRIADFSFGIYILWEIITAVGVTAALKLAFLLQVKINLVGF